MGIKVGLVQINNSFSGQNYLPLSVGMLQAYAQKNLKRPEEFEFLPPIFSRVPVESAVEALSGADVVFFSVYVWNIRISLEIARKLKERDPGKVAVFGGPHVPARPEQNESFLRRHSFIDLACIGEGERVTTEILERARTRAWQEVPSIRFIARDGRYIQTPPAARLSDLSAIPSPFLEGTFDALMEANPKEHWIGLWETNRGCPFSCTFCDWGSANQSKVYKFELDRLFREMDWFSRNKVEYVFCCDANFGMLPRDIDIARYVTQTKKRSGFPHAMSVQNTKNATERAYEVQKILSDAGLNKGVDIALQSIDPSTLTSVKRGNISTDAYQELQRRFARARVDTYTDLILGLPGETYDSFANGVSQITTNGQHNRIQFNNLSILPNAEMGDPEYQKKHGLVIVETKVVNIHGSLSDMDQGIYETQELVVATGAMPKADWVRVRAFAWMAAFLHFDKILQIPFVLLHEVCSVSYRELIELFLSEQPEDSPILRSVRRFFLEKAQDIQNGGFEYCKSKEWLGIWWPADEYLLIQLCVENRLGAFYREAEALLGRFLKEKFLDLPPDLLHASIELNHKLLKMPFQTSDLALEMPYNVWSFYQALLRGESVPLEKGTVKHQIDRTSQTWSTWENWFREVIWYGNKRGAYMYGNKPMGMELAGHY